MKSFRLIAIAALLAGGLLSCNKGNNSTPNANSTDEAADLVTASISTNTEGGALNSLSDITLSSETKINIDSLCGTVWTDSVSRSIPVTPGIANNYAYKGDYSYALNCTNGVFNHSASVTSAYSGSFNNATLSSTFAGSANFTISGLGKTYVAYVINGEYKRSGAFQSKADTSYHGTQSVNIVFTNLTLTKPLEVIKTGGSASFTISGNMPSKGGAFNYTGTIVFNGDDNATLTVNGTVYLINLATGTKQKK